METYVLCNVQTKLRFSYLKRASIFELFKKQQKKTNKNRTKKGKYCQLDY